MARCTKHRYRDRIAALMALADAQHKDSSTRPKIEQRAYECPRCRGWHLTAKAVWQDDSPRRASRRGR